MLYKDFSILFSILTVAAIGEILVGFLMKFISPSNAEAFHEGRLDSLDEIEYSTDDTITTYVIPQMYYCNITHWFTAS